MTIVFAGILLYTRKVEGSASCWCGLHFCNPQEWGSCAGGAVAVGRGIALWGQTKGSTLFFQLFFFKHLAVEK